MVALDPRQRVDQFLVAHHEADAPASHVVALAHGEKLDRHVARARHLHDGRRPVSVETDIGIRQVVDDQDIVFARKLDHALEELEIDALRGRIAGEPEDHHLRLRNRLAHRALDLDEEIRTRRHRDRVDVGTRDHGPVYVNRVARIGHQHRVAGIERCEHQMGQAFLGANRHDRLGIGVEGDVIAAQVPVGDGLAQARNPLGYRIAMGRRARGRLDELFHDVGGRRAVGIAHRHIDNVLATATGGHLELARNIEHVERQTLDSRELHHRKSLGWQTGFAGAICSATKPSNLAQGDSPGKSEHKWG